MNFTLPNRPIRDREGRWVPGVMSDAEIRAEMPAATGARLQALAAEWRFREGRDSNGDVGLGNRQLDRDHRL
jgi:hypothetical protein